MDAAFLLGDIRRFAQLDAFPAGRVVVQFRFTDAPPAERAWWLVVEDRSADLCRDDPGHEVDVLVESTVRALTEVWTGDSDPQEELRAGTISVSGAGRRGERLWRWLGRSMFAPTRLAARAAA